MRGKHYQRGKKYVRKALRNPDNYRWSHVRIDKDFYWQRIQRCRSAKQEKSHSNVSVFP